MLLYADEDFPGPVVIELRRMGHDVLTAQEDGLIGTPDHLIVARAYALGRIVLTLNRSDFERLDRHGADHMGIASGRHDRDHLAQAARIHAAFAGRTPGRWCIRVNRPQRTP